jgi:hemolysin type calcium-binding protein
MNRTRLVLLSTALLLFSHVLTAAAELAPGSQSVGGCRYVEAGRPGPADNSLVIDRNVGGVGVRRDGDSIVVYSPVVDKNATLACEGPRATVDDTDRIVYRPPGGGDPPRIAHRLDVDLEGGMFEPGASPDHGPGGSEIEIIADLPREPPNKQSRILVFGSASGDRMRIGALSRRRTGVNLDLRRDHYLYDADLIVSAAKSAHFSLRGEGGNDRIGATGMGSELDGPIRQRSLEIRGGDGSDTIYAGPERDIVDGGIGADTIFGGEGGDRLTGAEGNDRLFGGAGDDEIGAGSDQLHPFSDTLSGGSGRDALHAIDGNRDAVQCGPGADQAYVDAIDEWNRASCEKQHGPDFPR